MPPNYQQVLGYDPNAGARSFGAPSTREQWASDAALHFAEQYANGVNIGAPGSLFTNDIFRANGLNLLDPNSAGTGQVDTTVYSTMLALFNRIAANGGQGLDPSMLTGLPPIPTQSDGGQPQMSQGDRNNIASATSREADRQTQLAIENLQQAGMDRRSAQELASRLSIAQLQEAGASQRAAAQLASQEKIATMESQDRRYGIDVQARTASEDIAARERIASGDRSSREKIAAQDVAERGREFDLNLSENRRQFNSDLIWKMFDRGVELAKNPVDWVGYQYYLGNIGIPLNALTMTSAAALHGAIPPSGPSEVGPVIGGPAVIDGDTSFAQAAGIQDTGPVSIQQAITMNPGGTVIPGAQSSTQTVEKLGGAGMVDDHLAQARQQLPQVLGQDNPFAAQAVQAAQQVQVQNMGRQAPGMNPLQPKQPSVGLPGWPAPPVEPQSAAPPATMGQPGQPPQPLGGAGNAGMHTGDPYMPLGQQPPPPPTGQNAGPTAGGLAGAMPGGVGGIYTGNEGTGAKPDPIAISQPGMQGAPIQPGTLGGGAISGVGGAGNAGMIGDTQASGGQPPQGSTSQIEQMLAQLAAQTGIPIEQLRQLFPAQLMTPAYSQSVLENSPIIQSLRSNGGNAVSGFNTGPATGSPFTNIRALGPNGTETGVRGGQDYNATALMTANPEVKAMLEGAIRGTGQSWNDFQYQNLRSAPITNYDPGSAGRRVFGGY